LILIGFFFWAWDILEDWEHTHNQKVIDLQRVLYIYPFDSIRKDTIFTTNGRRDIRDAYGHLGRGGKRERYKTV
jgi:hypothetical protein